MLLWRVVAGDLELTPLPGPKLDGAGAQGDVYSRMYSEAEPSAGAVIREREAVSANDNNSATAISFTYLFRLNLPVAGPVHR